MKKKDTEIKSLMQYYKNTGGLVIVALNDSQGVKVTSTIFKKGLLERIAKVLKDKELHPTVINAFSLTMNKTEHIDYLLENNLSLEEIKLSQIYGAISAYEKAMTDFNLPVSFGQIANIYRTAYQPKKGDEKIFITDTLKNAVEPTVIYSSGVNNLMRVVGNNPIAIKGDYKRRNQRPNYNYTVNKAENPQSLQSTMDGIERNFENILSLNHNTDIYTLGAYIPKALELEGMNIFRDLVLQYNEKLQKLCEDYGVTFINTEAIGKKYNKSTTNFHITAVGHNALANYILSCMYERKILERKMPKLQAESHMEVTDVGPRGIIKETLNDCLNTIYKESEESIDYSKKRERDIAKEHLREAKIFLQVVQNSKTERKSDNVLDYHLQAMYNRYSNTIERLDKNPQKVK